MSMDLYLWKAPVTDDPDEARRLLDLYFKQQETGVFEPSPDIAAAARALQRLYPIRRVSGEELLATMPAEEQARYTAEGLAELRKFGSYTQDEDGPWADLPHGQTDNLLTLSIRWSADNQALDDIVRVGREHELVIYDPQGPSIYLPGDPIEPEPELPPTLADHLKIWGMAFGLAALTYAAWLIPYGWLRWPLVAVGAFFTIAALIVVYAMLTEGGDQRR